MGITEDQAVEGRIGPVLDQREVDRFRQRACGFDTAKPEIRGSFELVDIGKLRNHIGADRRGVTRRFGDHEVHIVIGRQLVGAVVVCQNNLAPIGNLNTADPLFASIQPRVAVGIQKDGAAGGVGAITRASDDLYTANVSRILRHGRCSQKRKGGCQEQLFHRETPSG